MREKDIDICSPSPVPPLNDVIDNTLPHEVEAPAETSDPIPPLNESMNTPLSLKSEPCGSEDK